MRITLAFALGIVLASKISFSFSGLLLLCVLFLSVAVILNRYYAYKFESSFGLATAGLFIVLGMLFYESHNKPPVLHSSGTFVAHILETVEEKPNSYKSLVKVDAVFRNDSVFTPHEKVVVYFEKTKAAQQLKPGNTLLFKKSPERIKNSGNPYEFDYKSYLANKKIYRQIYLGSNDWEASTIQKTTPRTLAEKYRDKLLEIYRKQELGAQETEILSALTLGYKRGLDPETKRTFSSAGAMHVLAVSGLHVGILFWVFTSLLGFMRKYKYGKPAFVFLALLMLWAYAFITGLSPSVMRAATMFSLVCIANNINRRPVIYNTLSFSALLLLIINPNNLFEVGFQLSYAAVFGIVFLQPKIEKLVPVKNKILGFFWQLLTVSVAAQLTTFPITSYYFNQFPTYFWLSNLVVIPAVFILIVLGIMLLLGSGISWIAPPIAFLTKGALKLVYGFLKGIESLPWAVGEISVSQPELILLILAFATGFVFIEFKKIKALNAMLLCFVLLATANLAGKYRQLRTAELIIYNNTSNLVLHLIKGKANYVISSNPINDTDYILRSIETVRKKKALDPPTYICCNQRFVDSLLFFKSNIIYFEGKFIWFAPTSDKLPAPIQPHLLISDRRELNKQNLTCTPLLVSNTKYGRPEAKNAYFLRDRGAYHKKWKGASPQQHKTPTHSPSSH